MAFLYYKLYITPLCFQDLLPQLIDVFPVGTSIKLLHHYWQNFRSGISYPYSLNFAFKYGNVQVILGNMIMEQMVTSCNMDNLNHQTITLVKQQHQ